MGDEQTADEWDAGALAPESWLARQEGLIPTRTVVLIETITGDGQTGFHHLVSRGCHEWQEMGMLRAAVAAVQEAPK